MNNISTFSRDGSNIKPATTRAVLSNVWTFIPADLFCNAPEFVEEEGKIRIKCNTNAANIYINTENNDAFLNIILKKLELLEKEGFAFRKPQI